MLAYNIIKKKKTKKFQKGIRNYIQCHRTELFKKINKWLQAKFYGERHSLFYTFPRDIRYEFGETNKTPYALYGTQARESVEKFIKKFIVKEQQTNTVVFARIILVFQKPFKIKMTFTIVYYDKILCKWLPQYIGN